MKDQENGAFIDYHHNQQLNSNEFIECFSCGNMFPITNMISYRLHNETHNGRNSSYSYEYRNYCYECNRIGMYNHINGTQTIEIIFISPDTFYIDLCYDDYKMSAFKEIKFSIGNEEEYYADCTFELIGHLIVDPCVRNVSEYKKRKYIAMCRKYFYDIFLDKYKIIELPKVTNDITFIW